MSLEVIEAPKLNVNEKLTLPEADADLVRAAQGRVNNLHQVLGQKLATFKIEEATILQAISKAEEELHNVVTEAGNRHGLQIATGEMSYNFNSDTMEFVRLK